MHISSLCVLCVPNRFCSVFKLHLWDIIRCYISFMLQLLWTEESWGLWWDEWKLLPFFTLHKSLKMFLRMLWPVELCGVVFTAQRNMSFHFKAAVCPSVSTLVTHLEELTTLQHLAWGWGYQCLQCHHWILKNEIAKAFDIVIKMSEKTPPGLRLWYSAGKWGVVSLYIGTKCSEWRSTS